MKKNILFFVGLLLLFSCASNRGGLKNSVTYISKDDSIKIANRYDSLLRKGNVDVKGLSLNDIYGIIKYSYIKEYYGITHKLLDSNINMFKDDKKRFVDLLIIYSDVEKSLGNYSKSDSLFDETLNYVRENFSDSIFYLTKVYTNYGALNIEKQHYISANKLLQKAIYYAQTGDTNFIYLIRDYQLLNQLYYYKGISTTSIRYFYKAIELLVRLKRVDDGLKLVYENINYLKSRSMPLSKLNSVLEKFDINKLNRKQRAFYLVLKAKILDDDAFASADTLKIIYTNLDSIYKEDKSIFNDFYTLYFETFYPILNRLKMYDEAQNLFTKITDDFGAKRDSLIDEQTVNLAYWAYNTGNYAQSQQLFKKALKEYKKKYGNESPMVAELLDKMGVMYLSSGLTFEANNLLSTSFEIKKKYLKNNSFEMGISYLNLGEVKRQQNDYQQAIKMYKKTLDYWSKIQDSTYLYRAKVFHSLGVVYVDAKEYDSAYKYLNLAYILKKKNFGDKSPSLIYTDVAIAKYYDNISQLDSAYNWFKTSKDLIDYNGLNNTVYELSYNIGIGFHYYKSSKFELAKKYLSSAIKFLSKNSEANSDKIREIEKVLLKIAQKLDNRAEVDRLNKKLYGDL